MSVREAVAAETAATNAAVAAAATDAAAEAAAASKAAAAHEAAAEAAAAANERRALDVRLEKARPAVRARRRRGIHGRRGTFPGSGVWSGGPGPRPRGDGAWVVAAPRHGLRRDHRDGLRPPYARVHGLRIELLVALGKCHGAGVRVLR